MQCLLRIWFSSSHGIAEECMSWWTSLNLFLSSSHTFNATYLYTTHVLHLSFVSLPQLSKQALSKQTQNKLSRACAGGRGLSWAAATARLHPIKMGSVEKGCGLEPVTSVPVPSAPTALCREKQRREREREREVRVGVDSPRRSSRRPAGCLQDLRRQLVLYGEFIPFLQQCHKRKTHSI